MEKPILGISMGDPFGNGPEITVKALAGKKRETVGLYNPTAAYNEDGHLKNIYLAGEFGGFSIHILQK